MNKPIQMGIFDIRGPSPPPPEPKGNHDPALINFVEDIDGKKTLAKLGEWRMKHQHRINKLSTKQREVVDNYYQNRKEILK